MRGGMMRSLRGSFFAITNNSFKIECVWDRSCIQLIIELFRQYAGNYLEAILLQGGGNAIQKDITSDAC